MNNMQEQPQAEKHRENDIYAEQAEGIDYTVILNKIEKFLMDSAIYLIGSGQIFEDKEYELEEQLKEIEQYSETFEQALNSEKHFSHVLYLLADLANNNLPFFSETDIGQHATTLGSEIIRKHLGRLEQEIHQGAGLRGDDWRHRADMTDASLRAIIALVEGESKFGFYDEYKEDAQRLNNLADLVETIIREEINSDPDDWESKITIFSQALFPIFEHGNRDNQFRAAKIAADVFSLQGKQYGTSGADSAVFAILKRLKAKGLDNLDLKRKENFFFHKIMQAYDLDSNDVYDAWTKSVRNMRQKFSDIAYRNLTTMREIDFATSLFESGVVPFLNKEYGIYDFARYPTDLLVEQYMEKDRADVPYGLIITPRDDWNGAFYQDRNIYGNVLHRIQLIGQPDEHWVMRVIEVENKRELGRFALKFSKTYGQAKFGIVGGHGAPKDIGLGAGYKNMEILNVDDLFGRGVQRGGAMLFEKGSTIILNSCETGVESGIAQQASEMFGSKIIGPDQPTSIKQIIVEKNDDKLQFRVEYNKGAPHTYDQGKQLN